MATNNWRGTRVLLLDENDNPVLYSDTMTEASAYLNISVITLKDILYKSKGKVFNDRWLSRLPLKPVLAEEWEHNNWTVVNNGRLDLEDTPKSHRKYVNEGALKMMSSDEGRNHRH